jgi:hypothetical protein
VISTQSNSVLEAGIQRHTLFGVAIRSNSAFSKPRVHVPDSMKRHPMKRHPILDNLKN